MAETTSAVVKYQARDGQEITLSFETIRKYLVQGKSEYVTPQELMYFMGVCKSQGMNPFKRDCWLIKYSQGDAAGIISAIGFLRSRAKAMSDCKGWQAGIIVKRGKDVIYSNGLMLEGDILLGGWARGKPEGWETETVKEVNLNGYIKHTKEGNVTRFWKPENQPTQIAKVAEGQLLRTLWPDQFKDIYTDAEISPDDDVKLLSAKEIKPESETQEDLSDLINQFDASIPEGINLESLNTFLSISAEAFERTVDEVKADVAQNPANFWEAFKTWETKQKTGHDPQKKKEDPIRREYINLGPKNFEKWVIDRKVYIPELPQPYQDELKAKWDRMKIEREYPVGDTITEKIPKEGQAETITEDKPDPAPSVEEEAAALEMMIPCDMKGEEVHVAIQCADKCEDSLRLRCKEFAAWRKNHPDVKL